MSNPQGLTLQECKSRAVAYLHWTNTETDPRVKCSHALASFLSDTKDSEAVGDERRIVIATIMSVGMAHAMAGDTNQLRSWIEGFN